MAVLWELMGFDGIYPLVIQHSYGKAPLFLGKLTVSMAMFNSYVRLPEGNDLSIDDDECKVKYPILWPNYYRLVN